MKKHLFNMGIILLFIIMLFFPNTVFSGASSGLQLWFQIVFPTLFPFLLVSNFLLVTDSIFSIAKIFGKPLSFLFHTSAASSFVIIAGFLCGYPVGAKLTSDLYMHGYITKKEGDYLLSFCNNLSPGFILSFIVLQNLKQDNLKLPTLIILFISPCIISLFTRKIYSFQPVLSEKNAILSQTEHFGESSDFCIKNSFETLLKIGGYIILFSVLSALLQHAPLPPFFLRTLLPSLEITNGIVFLSRLPITFSFKYILILALSSFGGFCALAQTGCMIREAGFSLRCYLIEKLAAAMTASLLGYLYLILFVNIC